MESLTLSEFLTKLEPFAHTDLLIPSEASKLQLAITELLVDYYVDYPLLKFLSRFLSQQSYDEIIEERNIDHQCGYLICDKSPRQQVRRASTGAMLADRSATKFQIYNRKPSMILPNTYLSQYCCKDHYQASIFYRNQLSNEAMFARKDIMVVRPFSPEISANWYENGITCLEEVLSKHKELKGQGKSISDVIAMMSGLSVSEGSPSPDTSELIKLIEDFEIVEKEGGVTGDVDEDDELDYAERANGIDGYVTTNKSFGGYVV
ncbi:uncharacterized protein CANTADRAFT_24603 [Suhomyces tanzawaensis NRRL Y-17324]|uniref:RNA polymerase II subunit B1 CTD phosphatase RPAP2 homolog n=1 Tax=Suhomyces tanzawaensis NRRL Y-17324 TaxID=984487 RepID=A0A1E4SQN7_9ASCO|nr:uncharacterized protein CANTADRAFT_24603 [Suhomyces tanzawaensis NRRL Y-17324]ODV81819.1 hypothetical protein CANTADRAFT_24603 [Suhomyces tanzawaensis NRRL Y-17324]